VLFLEPIHLSNTRFKRSTLELASKAPYYIAVDFLSFEIAQNVVHVVIRFPKYVDDEGMPPFIMGAHVSLAQMRRIATRAVIPGLCGEEVANRMVFQRSESHSAPVVSVRVDAPGASVRR